jgi:hypothetical protein
MISCGMNQWGVSEGLELHTLAIVQCEVLFNFNVC